MTFFRKIIKTFVPIIILVIIFYINLQVGDRDVYFKLSNDVNFA